MKTSAAEPIGCQPGVASGRHQMQPAALHPFASAVQRIAAVLASTAAVSCHTFVPALKRQHVLKDASNSLLDSCFCDYL